MRLALIAYLHVNKIRRADPSLFPGCANMLQILELAIIDTKLRGTVEKHTSQILNLLLSMMTPQEKYLYHQIHRNPDGLAMPGSR